MNWVLLIGVIRLSRLFLIIEHLISRALIKIHLTSIGLFEKRKGKQCKNYQMNSPNQTAVTSNQPRYTNIPTYIQMGTLQKKT